MSGDLNLQHNFLERLREKEIPVTVYLKNGVQIRGLVDDYDSYVIALKADGDLQVLMKKGITTIEPDEKVEDYFPEEY